MSSLEQTLQLHLDNDPDTMESLYVMLLSHAFDTEQTPESKQLAVNELFNFTISLAAACLVNTVEPDKAYEQFTRNLHTKLQEAIRLEVANECTCSKCKAKFN